VKIVDFHVHIGDPAWQALDPVLAGARRLASRVTALLPGNAARTALTVAGSLAEPLWRAARDGALDGVDSLLALTRNRAIYLGDRGAKLAPGLDALFKASFLRATPENLLSSMDAAGISGSVVLPIEPFTTTDMALAACRGTGRLIPFATVSTKERDPAGALARMKARGARGLKLHPAIQDQPPDSPFHRALVGAAQDLRIPVVAHTGCVDLEGYGDPGHARVEAYEPLLREFPRVRFVLAHMNLFDPGAAIDAARRFENVFLDTSWQPEGIVRRAAKALGASRLVFGSDWPFPGARPRSAIDIVVRALDRRPEALEQVLWRNACRLLDEGG
jgi:predicted TIM-barrel fold metal-dependent hydrolase